MKKIIRLTETDLTNLVKRVIKEQRTPFLTVFPNKSILSKSAIEAQNGGNIIYLTKRDPKTGKAIPGTKLSYRVGGKYGMLPFDIGLRNVERGLATGSLYAEVKPKNNTVFNIIKGLLPKENDKDRGKFNYLTNDGWIKVAVLGGEINAALGKLFDNEGDDAKVDVPNSGGISITLERI